jgi:hypothetical protein
MTRAIDVSNKFMKDAASKMRTGAGDIGAIIAANRAELKRGTVLDPMNHPSYSDAKVAALVKAAASRSRAVKSANTRFENAAAAA